MKILYLCADAGIPVLGRKGAAVHVREICGAFARAGHRVTLAAQCLVKSVEEKPAKVRARVVHLKPQPEAVAAVHAFKQFHEQLGLENSLTGELRRVLHNEACYLQLKRRFLKHRPDFIYERASLYGIAGVRLAAKLKVPLIVELNAPLAVEQATYRATGFGELAAQAERWTLTHADAVVVVSAQLAEHVKSLGVSRRRIHVMPNGVNPELFHPIQKQAARESNGGSARVLGFVGGLRPWHGVEVLPQLLARLNRRFPGTRLVIAGDGQMRGTLETEFKRRGLSRQVEFTGALTHEEIPNVIRRFDVALAPYPKHNHDFYFSPLKLYEYMACGVPVVASRVGQIAQTVRHGETGLLYPPGDLSGLVKNCERLFENRDLAQKLSAAAAQMVRGRFTWDRNVTRVIKLASRLQSV